jgi:hypothetical protein
VQRISAVFVDITRLLWCQEFPDTGLSGYP